LKELLEKEKSKENKEAKEKDEIRKSINSAVTNELNKSMQTIKDQVIETAIKEAVKVFESSLNFKPVVNRTVHKTVTCNECSMYPIIGNRYKCTVCLDYDLCEACENKESNHKHTMLKYKVECLYPKCPRNEKNCERKKSPLKDKDQPVHDIFNEFVYSNKVKEMRGLYDLKDIKDDRIIEALKKTKGNVEEAVCELFLINSKVNK